MKQSMKATANAHGFELKESAPLKEIDGTAHVMHHSASGARLLFLENDDPEKSFSISFKTPAADDTGVFHILEHSVLCGSKRFPVKEPFVNLLKSSMQTFLNAMTFPDKTMYPVASTNDQDLMNLMQVYLDAVFFPNIYSKRTIFEQEGWHLEFAEDEPSAPEDAPEKRDAAPERRLVYNGVVFNEMKGALSDPDSVLYDVLSAALFPDTTYRFESGGIPEAIPTLTYEAFLDAHKRHYRPDNSYIVLYGDMDVDKYLKYIDEEYLTPLATDPSYASAPSVRLGDGAEAVSIAANPLDLQDPVVQMGVKHEMCTTPDNSCAALGFVIGTTADRERLIAADILMDAIMGSNVAPMKKALLEAGIADDCNSSLIDSVAQPFVMIQAKGLKENAVEKLVDTVAREAKRLSEGGLNRKLIEAALSHAEFIMREHNFGYSDGVIYAMSALSGWLYDDDMPYSFIEYEDVFASLRKKIDEGYFETLISEVFLSNDHHAQVEIVPVDKDPSAVLTKRLDALAETFTAKDLDEVTESLRLLREAQSELDDPADLAKLPKLDVADIKDAPPVPDCKVVTEGGRDVLVHAVPTHGLVYTYRYFDLGVLTFEEIPYATVLSMVLGKLDTHQHSAEELDTLIQDKLGNLSFLKEVYEKSEAADGAEGADSIGTYVPKFVVSTSALEENAAHAAAIADEVMYGTDFSSSEKILEILVQRRVMIEQKFATAGNSIAVARANSYYSEAGVLREQMAGVDFYLFLKDLIDSYDSVSQHLGEKLAAVAAKIFSQTETVSFAGSEAALDSYLGSLDAERCARDGRSAATDEISAEHPQYALVVPAPIDKHEAFVAPCDITFTGLSADRRALGMPMSGGWLVASRILTYGYLWNEVRVKGGAYGVSFTMSRQGPAHFSSYRDPHIDRTMDAFTESADWLADFKPTAEEFDGFIVSSAASFDAPLKPRALVRRQDTMHFTDYSEAERMKYRQQVLQTKLEDVQALAPELKALCKIAHACTVGNKQMIEQSNEGFEVIDILS